MSVTTVNEIGAHKMFVVISFLIAVNLFIEAVSELSYGLVSKLLESPSDQSKKLSGSGKNQSLCRDKKNKKPPGKYISQAVTCCIFLRVLIKNIGI